MNVGMTNWTRLCGAFTMLALLGVPWMFSAFGAIQAGNNNTLSVLGDIFNVRLYTNTFIVSYMFIVFIQRFIISTSRLL